MWIQYRRDAEGHIWPESYELGVSDNARSTLRRKRRFSILAGREFPLAEIEQRLRGVLRVYGTSVRDEERGIAINFASRCWRQVKLVRHALGRIEELRPP
jgi:hypothetical protein